MKEGRGRGRGTRGRVDLACAVAECLYVFSKYDTLHGRFSFADEQMAMQ